MVINAQEYEHDAYSYLDSLDAFLIVSIQEVEELRQSELMQDQLEEELTRIWQRTYAFAADQEEERLAAIWLSRGRTIIDRYPDAAQRRRIYKTSLTPLSANSLLDIEEAVRTKLLEGAGYACWTTDDQFNFIRDVLSLLSLVPSFRIKTNLGRSRNFRDWPTVLKWWLAKGMLRTQPPANKITQWFDFVSQNFIYRGTWGIGSILGLLLNNDDGNQPIQALEIGDWPRTGLPWIAFWIKELITWGTLDPVAAFLLARSNAVSRTQAEADARNYYEEIQEGTSTNDVLDPRLIRNWVDARRTPVEVPFITRKYSVDAVLARPSTTFLNRYFTVTPIEADNSLYWIEASGYKVAHSEKPYHWPDNPSIFEFELDVEESSIVGNMYLQHA